MNAPVCRGSVLSLALLLAGCGTTPSQDWLLVPAVAAVASDAGYLKMPLVASAAVLYLVMDPLAPNWTIQEARQGEDRYTLALRLKAVHSGGDGEARQVFSRRAAQLAGQPGFGAYEVMSWQEGVESSRPFARRVAYGEVRLLRQDPAPGTRLP
jgi:hypothetical protein